MDEKVRVALIGFGGMGQNYARKIFSGMVPHMVLSCVCCRNQAGQELLAGEFPGVQVYESVDILAEHGDEFDAVMIITPHLTHVPIAKQMAAMGKHILMDKPASVAAGEVEELVALCRAKDVSYGMIFNNRRLPAFRTAREMLQNGGLGQLHRAVWVCNSWYRSPAYHRSASWRSSWIREGGGLLINQNVHYLDMWQWLFGMPDKLYAAMEFGRYNDFSVDDAVDIQFSYENGFHGTMVSASGEAPGVNRLEIWGSKGRLIVEDGARLYLDENEVSTEEFALTNTVKFAEIPHTLREIPLDNSMDPYCDVFENYARHLLYGDELYSTGVDGLKTARLTNAAYVSGWEERRITLPMEDARFLEGWKLRCEEEAGRGA